MPQIDKKKNNTHNTNVFVITNGEESLTINKRDLSWTSAGAHKHHLLPDFTDEWDKAIALKCAKAGCIYGRMVKKDSKEFIDWLEKLRAKE